MKKVINLTATLMLSATLTAWGGTLCSGDSATTVIDLVSGVRTAAATERIRYSTAWADGAAADAVAVVEVDGEDTLVVSAGSGYADWTPTRSGTYTLTHKVMSGDEQIGTTLSATFVVTGPPAPTISPASGSTFGEMQTITIECADENAAIYYTLDGSEPTAESTLYRRFRIIDKTTVKAVAVKDGVWSEVAVAHYALGIISYYHRLSA